MPEFADPSINKSAVPLSLLEPDRVDKICIEKGNLYPWQMNQKRCLCQKCRKEDLPSGTAIRFMKDRIFNHNSNGYYCFDCVVEILGEFDWHWNPATEEMFPKRPYTMHPIHGADLAAAFKAKGERGIYKLVVDQHCR